MNIVTNVSNKRLYLDKLIINLTFKLISKASWRNTRKQKEGARQYKCVTVFSFVEIESVLITAQLDSLQPIKELPTQSSSFLAGSQP